MRIQDPIYGRVEVSALNEAFMDTPQFQRLRGIRQLGMTPSVFPSGVHTRFEHSIGVMHLATAMFIAVIQNTMELGTYTREELCIFQDTYLHLVSLAGLLHDIGHLAFSHTFELCHRIKGKQFDHESYSTELVAAINEELRLLTPEEVSLVQHMIKGNKKEGYPAWVFQFVNNKLCGGLDVDKLDYIVRDSHHLGLEKIDINFCYEATIDGSGNLSYPMYVMPDIYNVFMRRRKLYRDVYFHPTVAKVDAMMVCAMSQIDWVPEDYLLYDDMYVMYQIRHVLKHDIVRCMAYRTFDHVCSNCSGIVATLHKRKPKLSGDTESDPVQMLCFH